ncbi:MAG: hypothetical protein ACLPHP_06640 [Candidatus Sulfotelmatobacter sp.]
MLYLFFVRRVCGCVYLSTLVLFFAGCGGGSSSQNSNPPPPPPQPVCAAPATSNPVGGGGIYSQIQIDPAVYGTRDPSGLTVFGFSQESQNLPADPQVLEMQANIVPRAWQRWDVYGTQSSQYNWSYPAQAQAAGITFIGGSTATVLFPDEFPVAAQFNSVVSCNAQGQPVVHAPLNYYRGSMASPAYRNYIIGIGELQIDGGVDGLFFDEADESYEGATYGNGNEGFDDADVADFGGFLCAKYSNLSAAQWQTQFGVMAADKLNCSTSSDQWGRTFNYRGYLARNGWQTDPLNSSNPLAAEWGSMQGGHPEPENGTFTGTYTSLVYWQNIVVTLRNYARQKYGKEIYITANGVFPFVDFQMNGLWDGNPDGPGGTSADYCPVTASGDLDGTQSLLAAFLSIKQRSARIDGRVVPVAAFIDWPTGVMTRYLSLPSSEQSDYWRMYVPEALAATVYLNMHLLDTIGDPTATQLGLMPLFEQTAAFYEMPAHAALYHGTQDLPGAVTVSVPNISTNLTQLSDGRTVAHLINHNYSQGFQEQDGVGVAFPLAQAPTTVTLVSPDYSADTEVPFTYSGGLAQVVVPKLIAYVAVVAQ